MSSEQLATNQARSAACHASVTLDRPEPPRVRAAEWLSSRDYSECHRESAIVGSFLRLSEPLRMYRRPWPGRFRPCGPRPRVSPGPRHSPWHCRCTGPVRTRFSSRRR